MLDKLENYAQTYYIYLLIFSIKQLKFNLGLNKNNIYSKIFCSSKEL